MSFSGVVFPVEVPRITMPFRATETKWYSEANPHRGVDIAPWPGSTGRPVFAPLASRVHWVGETQFAGKEVVLACQVPYAFWAGRLSGATHRQVAAKETFWLRMTHHSEVLVRANEWVHAGHVIARVGSTGEFSTGPHVHLELRVGERYDGSEVLNPMDFLISSIVGLRQALVPAW
jgi:murein DD-endopeptidase MepM/ murein hydrolase activator NlpD